MTKLLDIYIAEINGIKHVTGLLPSLIMQVITREEILAFQRNGGNALGITDKDGPLLRKSSSTLHMTWVLLIVPKVICNAIRWNEPIDDTTVQEAGNKIMDRAVALAKKMGVHHRFIYQNYANKTQDVFGSYGEENKGRLVQIQKKYDPEGIFRRFQPGYFTL
jgi:hypothetical protein